MEKYKEIEKNAPNALNATPDVTVTHEGNQNMDIARQLKAKLEKNKSPNVGVLKIASGNVTKWLKARQDMRVATRATKNAEATIKQIVAQQLQAEKVRMQE